MKGSLIALVGVEVVIGELLCRTTSNTTIMKYISMMLVRYALLGGYLVIITMQKWSAFHTKNEGEKLLETMQSNQIMFSVLQYNLQK